jgi:hypothetical protein
MFPNTTLKTPRGQRLNHGVEDHDDGGGGGGSAAAADDDDELLMSWLVR